LCKEWPIINVKSVYRIITRAIEKYLLKLKCAGGSVATGRATHAGQVKG
jgi:hypothetical protein